jgi:GNAT superfamily N-acetyltransferase
MLDRTEVIDTLLQYRRAHFDLNGRGCVSLRFGLRFVEGRALMTLDVASIDVIEAYRRQGVFAQTVADCERIAREAARKCVYVECIHNPIVTEALGRRGYTVRGASPEWTAYKLL